MKPCDRLVSEDCGWSWALAAGVILMLSTPSLGEDSAPQIPRRPDGRPDLTGTYDVATLTPLERPPEYGGRLTLTDEEAAVIGEGERERMRQRGEASDPDREAPPQGGDGSTGAAGNVGGYNTFWIDRGEGAFKIDGRWRTSILVDPPDGQLPPLSEQGKRRAAELAQYRRENDGIAWWAGMDRGPYDDPEVRPLGERCILSRSRSGPPILSALYNNLKRIVQTDDYVMILAEQMHDARIIRLDAAHQPETIRKWMGDSVGHWEEDTLVVDTTNFLETPLTGDSVNAGLRVVERFTRIDDRTILYRFTVHDPSFTAPWTGEYVWPATEGRVYEYACHEGNYSFGNILRGARVLEKDALQQESRR
jgi:hypothetical protein